MLLRRLRLKGLKKVPIADRHTHYAEINGLRAISVLGIVLAHISMGWKNNLRMEGAPPQLPLTLPLGGVDALNLFMAASLGASLLFLMSGYLLVWLEDERIRRGTFNVRSYALRRALRIVPAYYVAIVIIALLWPSEPSVEDILLNLSFLWVVLHPFDANTLDPIFWYLTSLVVFYCLVPFVSLWLPTLKQRLTLLGLLCAFSLGAQLYLIQNAVSPEVLQSGTLNLLYLVQLPFHLAQCMVGVVLRMMVERLGYDPAKPRWRPLIASGLLLVAASLFVTRAYLVVTPDSSRSSLFLGLVYLWDSYKGGLVAVLFFASAVLGAPLLRGVLRWKPLAFIGMISYSIFLYHTTVLVLGGPIMQKSRDLAESQGSALATWAAFSAYALTVFIASCIIAYLSYRYVESPFLQRKPISKR